MKSAYFFNKSCAVPDVEYMKLYDELQTRNYKKSVWKSQAEYNILLSDLSQTEKDALYAHLKNLKKADTKPRQYGYVPVDWQLEFNKYGIHEVIWVESSVKLKSIKPDETYILFKDTPVRFSDAALNIRDFNPNSTEFMYTGFYLYYTGQDLGVQHLERIGSYLSSKAKEYSSR